MLLAGVLDSTDVVAKLLVNADAFWHGKFAAEISTYRAFTLAPPPVPAPRLLAADPDAGVLVTTRCAGAPVARDRYPTRLTAVGAAALLPRRASPAIVDGAAGRVRAGWNYPDRFRRYGPSTNC